MDTLDTYIGREEKGRGIISTGNDELDKKIGGGIPLRSLTLVEGQPDSGMSVLTQQMLWGSVKNNLRAMVFTTENTVRSLLPTLWLLTRFLMDYLLLSRLRIYPVDIRRTRRSLSMGLMPLLSTCPAKGVDLAVIDSITYYITHASIEEILTFFEDCKVLCDQGLSIMCVAHSYAVDESVMVRLGSMSDAHLKLRMETMGAKMIKILEVAKVRGAEMSTGNIVSFDIAPNWGIKVIPYSKARA